MKNKACKYTTDIVQQKTSGVTEDPCAVTFRADKSMRPKKKTVFFKNNSQLTIRVTMQE